MGKKRCLQIVARGFVGLWCIASMGFWHSRQVSAAPALGKTVLVDTPADTSGGTCTSTGAPTGSCSLRSALRFVEQEVPKFQEPTSFTILFANSLNGATINLELGPLEWEAVCKNSAWCILDGETRAITISGSSLPAGAPILRITGSNNRVKNLRFTQSPGNAVEIGSFAQTGPYGDHIIIEESVFLGNQGAGVAVHTANALGSVYSNKVLNSLFGVSQGGGCAPGAENQVGVRIDNLVYYTTIQGNVIGCNRSNGVEILGKPEARPIDNSLESNWIGINRDGTPIPNHGSGIYDQGHTTQISNNVISGNGGNGIELSGTVATQVFSNTIGADGNASHAVPNGLDGVRIEDGSFHVKVGLGNSTGYGNVISGNLGNGLSIRGAAWGNSVDGNRIGVDQGGNHPIPNRQAGISIAGTGTGQNTIGSDNAAILQVISGNLEQGIRLDGAENTTIYPNNRIGTGVDGSSPLGNRREGVLLGGGTTGTAMMGSIVAYNGLAGVAIVDEQTLGNDVRPSSIFANGGLPIDLGNDGPAPRGRVSAGPVPVNGLIYPQIGAIEKPRISGSACADCQVEIYRAVGDPGAPGGGGVWVGSARADSLGAWSVTLPDEAANGNVTLISIDTTGLYNSSEMLPMSPVFVPLVLR